MYVILFIFPELSSGDEPNQRLVIWLPVAVAILGVLIVVVLAVVFLVSYLRYRRAQKVMLLSKACNGHMSSYNGTVKTIDVIS